MILGIDNGACSGAIVALSAWDGELLGYTTLPNHKVKGKTQLDTRRLRQWVCDFELPPTVVAVEEPLHHAPSSQSVRSMGICYGQILGLCCGMFWHTESVTVNEWQKSMLGKFPKGQSKKAALKKAGQMEPDQQWLDPRKPRARTPHDGIIDAYLIAKYAWKNFEENSCKDV